LKTYPSILGPSKAPHLPCIAFVKYDGSNLRFEFSKKRGWYKFGTRKTMFDKTDKIWGRSIDLFNETLAKPIENVLKTEKIYRGVDSVIVFCEYFGPSSFAGQHIEGEPMELRLFDVNIHKKGFVGPRDFVKYFGHIPQTAKVVYEGNLTKDFIESVKRNDYNLDEGVVCKGGEGHNLWMIKIKTTEWINRVKSKYPENWQKIIEPQEI
jgi:hypothetical protein